VVNSNGGTCSLLTGALIDIWHCDAIGLYSDERAYNPGGGVGTVTTTGQKFLRGYQVTDDNGRVRFQTIYPGWYGGRTIHIHVRVRTFNGTTQLGDFVSQFFFDDSITNAVLTQAPYNTRTSPRDTTNTNDGVYNGAANKTRMLMPVTKTDSGYSGSITLDVNLIAPPAALPTISSSGVVNAASGAAGISPGSWITILGSNLASTVREFQPSDLVDGMLPTSLGGVKVQVNGKAAFPYYVSPTQVNILAPADSSAGTALVSVTSTAVESNPVSATMRSIFPGLFTASKYVRAVRQSDSVIINGTGASEGSYASAAAARPGDLLQLYATGLGPTNSTIDIGRVFDGAYPTNSPVTVTIGGGDAEVSFAGLVGLGLYQINVKVPSGLAAGDQAVVVTTGGISSPSSGALLKVSA
jgi:uncharacterized protein (TIGR03437 family)